mmetsp:Transcript_124067/g.310104  ORF Transcript_124067/g.310104 Transcript_124067/m.310104 type:complete len:291 (-) Transcript_124067:968-1840(-)
MPTTSTTLGGFARDFNSWKSLLSRTSSAAAAASINSSFGFCATSALAARAFAWAIVWYLYNARAHLHNDLHAWEALATQSGSKSSRAMYGETASSTLIGKDWCSASNRTMRLGSLSSCLLVSQLGDKPRSTQTTSMVKATPTGGLQKPLISPRSDLFIILLSSSSASANSGAACSKTTCQPWSSAWDSTSTQLMSETESQLLRLETESLRFRLPTGIGQGRGWDLHILNHRACRFHAPSTGGHVYFPGNGHATKAAPCSALSSCSRWTCALSRAHLARISRIAASRSNTG